MRFVRHLREEFFNELNRLYVDEKSWWHKMVEDEKVFILVREKRIHIMVKAEGCGVRHR